MSRHAKEPETNTEELGEWLATTVLETAQTGAVPVLSWRLHPVLQKPPISEYIKEIWGRRHFIVADAKARAYQVTRGTLLGKVWLVLSPFLNSMIYWVIFGLLLQTSRGVPNFLGYLVIGFNFFAIYQNALTSGGGIIKGSENLIRAFTFPRASVVVSWVIRSFLDFLPIFGATLVFIIAVPPHALPNWRWLLTIPAILIGFVFSFGLALFTSAVTAIIPDMKFIWPLIGRFWFYVSGIFFTLERFESIPWVQAIMKLNPGYVFLSVNRDLLIYETVPDLNTWIYLAGWSFLMAAIGFIVFWMWEERYGQRR